MALTVALLQGAHADDALPDVCHLFQGDVEFVTQKLYMHQEKVGHALKIPKIYFEDPWDQVDGEVHRAQLFRVMFNDFTPVYRSHSAMLNKAGNFNYFSFVLHDLVPPEVLFDTQLWLSVPARRDNPRIKTEPREFFALESAGMGLKFAVPRDELKTIRDVFASFSEEGSVLAIISCRRKANALNPRCDHDFRASGIDVRPNYRRENLERWFEIQSDISAFVGCMKEP